MASEKQREDFADFVEWCRFNDLAMPVEGDEVAAYLLEVLTNGATLHRITEAAASIAASYARRKSFLDLIPLRAALEIAKAQLDPHRTLN
jgi:hypothetical protein